MQKLMPEICAGAGMWIRRTVKSVAPVPQTPAAGKERTAERMRMCVMGWLGDH